MAEENDKESYEIYWTIDDSLHSNSSGRDRRSFVPGVDQPIRKKRQTMQKMNPGKAAQEGRSRGQSSQVRQHNGKAGSRQQETLTSMAEPSKLKEKPSLKDLRPEDKKRIANLIRELAKAGEEKEVIVQQLNVERQTYEEKVKRLQNQMVTILKERELTQKQYLQCQKLLAEYQSQLASEQEKIAASFNLSTLTSPHKHNSSMSAPHSMQEQAPNTIPTSAKRLRNAHLGTPNEKTTHQAQQPTHHNATPRHSNGYQNTPHQSSAQLPQSNEVEFNPLLASTHQPQPSSHGEPAMQVSYGSKEHPRGYILRPRLNTQQGEQLNLTPRGTHIYPSDSQESRAQSGDFRPLPPEVDDDSRKTNSPDFINGSWNHQMGNPHPAEHPMSNRFPWAAKNGATVYPPGGQYLGDGPQVRKTLSSAQQLRHTKLERQKQELREEQAWLRQKLKDQEEMLLLKQSQLEQHKLHLLEQEWQRDQSHRATHWQRNGTDLEWEEPRLFNGKLPQRHSESENDSDDAASTNFPPENFINQSQTVLTNSLHELNLNRQDFESLRGEPSGGRRVAMATGGVTGGWERQRGEHIDCYASLYPNVQGRRKTQGSTSSSRSTSSSTNPPLVDRSTSPFHHRDPRLTAASGRVNTGTSPGTKGNLSLSPGRVTVTPAPSSRWRDVGSGSRRVDSQRHMEPLARSPRQPRHDASMRKSNVTHLSDLIDDLESPPPPTTTRARPVSTTHNTSTARHGHQSTPDLFRDEVLFTDTETEVQESRILEDVFFL
ncbi:protein hinderin-like [Asterias rubens]|uniref:protein hinderin-like n=1 Tax=Asterias rubens TaxID=7604 RepID=UPI001455ABEC|nr:protein hinderin-like [Asterias rubens]